MPQIVQHPPFTLGGAADLLEDVYYKIRARLVEKFPDQDPELATDAEGRYILLDALNSLVQARLAVYRRS